MKLLSRLGFWFRTWVDGRPPASVLNVEELPDALEPNTIYLEGVPPWVAVFLCPCGCGDAVNLSLIPNDRPRWRVRIHWDGTLTLSPSIWRTKGCKSHFFLRRGKIHWVRDFSDSRK